jgi:hypothetical protein
MTSQDQITTAGDFQGAQNKLQSLYDSMQAGEQRVLRALMRQASQPSEVEGYFNPVDGVTLSPGSLTPIRVPIKFSPVDG